MLVAGPQLIPNQELTLCDNHDGKSEKSYFKKSGSSWKTLNSHYVYDAFIQTVRHWSEAIIETQEV